jgi:hypothetical protein
VPLSTPALEIIEKMAAIRTGELIFSGCNEGTPLSNMAFLMLWFTL